MGDGGGGCTGMKREEETIKTLSEMHSKAVYELTLAYDIISEYKSCKEAGIKYKVASQQISTAARSRGTRSALNRIWIYVDEYKEWVSNRKNNKYIKQDGHKRKTVNQYSKDGKLIRHWKSIQEAAKVLKINERSITRARTGWRKTYAGYVWK